MPAPDVLAHLRGLDPGRSLEPVSARLTPLHREAQPEEAEGYAGSPRFFASLIAQAGGDETAGGRAYLAANCR